MNIHTLHDPVRRSQSLLLIFQDGGLNTSGETENDIPKFITDNNDKTNYVRGKFLGKVKIYYTFVTCILRW